MSGKEFKRFAASLLLAGTVVNADTLVLRNGTRLDGSYVGGDNRSIRFAVYDRVNTYSLIDVESVRFTGGNASSSQQGYPPAGPGVANSAPPAYNQGPYAAPGAPASSGNNGPYGPNGSYNNHETNNNQANSSGYNNNPSNNPTGLQVPAGTMLTVRLIDPVDSQNDRLGQTYRASLDQPVEVNGQTLLPRGADVVATLIDEQKSGKIQGRTSLTIDLKNVAVNGKQYDITTTGVSEESGSRGARSAKVIGGTAALGAIIGAVAGGGKGAAIGAGSGAALGTAAQVVTSGQRVKVPAETRLSFTLQNPITL